MEENSSALIVPSTDAHLSEYPPKYWESKWISAHRISRNGRHHQR